MCHTAMSHLRVAVVTETYPPEINGVANTMRHLVCGLEQRGHRVHVVRPDQAGDSAPCGERRPDETLVPGLPIPGYRGLRFGLPVLWRLRRLWRAQRPDLVYIATQGPLGRAALRAARAAAIPAVTGFHTQFQQYSQHYGLGLLAEPIARSLRRFHNRSDATLVPTAELRDRLTAQGFTNVQVFGRGVDTGLFSPARRSAARRAQWGCGPDDPALLYVGRLAAEKNVALVAETFAAAQAAIPNARCVLVGDGPELPRLRRSFPQFRFAGAKVGVALAEHYASADLFVFPSLTETFGNVVPEAMASGLAVIAFDEAAAHTYIRTGDNGIAVAPGDPGAFIAAAVGAARDVERLRRCGSRARITAETLGWDRVIDAVETCLFDVIHKRTAEDGHGRLARIPD
jgi:glycosyltransferase involved in cell wall biosynthesis